MSSDMVKLFAFASLALIGSSASMFGEFFRELAVLLVIFVPLELWKPQQGPVNSALMWHVGEGTVLFMGMGMFLEFTAKVAFRIKRDLEGRDGND